MHMIWAGPTGHIRPRDEDHKSTMKDRNAFPEKGTKGNMLRAETAKISDELMHRNRLSVSS